MQLYSTNNKDLRVDLREAVMNSLPADKGLYMPVHIPEMPEAFFEKLTEQTFQESSFRVAEQLLQGALPSNVLENIIHDAINFPAPLVHIDETMHILELFHGPSLAFKDFGARFMAKLMGYYNKDADEDLIILVATSGDTGGAVAAGFHHTPGIQVVILYPSGKVSELQEKQLTTLGGNITALEVDGTFDDCQALVKQAFVDSSVNNDIRLSSANSINIARLIPQSFYYFEAYKQLENKSLHTVFSVPSGNFGNLTAGLMAKRMGLPILKMLAATNINKTVPDYLDHGSFRPVPSIHTLSNAMDVGNPSNFSRMDDLYGSTWNSIKNDVIGLSVNDEDTIKTMQQVYQEFGYVLDPHGAVGYRGSTLLKSRFPDSCFITLETAHPSKFITIVEDHLKISVDIPERLSRLNKLSKSAIHMNGNYDQFKDWLLSYFN